MTQATIANPATGSSNTIVIDDVGPARKRLTITVPAEMVNDKLEEAMGTLVTQTALPGFRKGHAPKGLIEKRFGTSVRAETRNQLIASAYAQAVEEHKLKPVGEPEPAEGTDIATLELAPGKPLTFAVEVEVVPTFELPKLDGLTIRKPMLQIGDEHIDAELKRQQQQHGTVHKIDGDFQEGDRLGGYATVTKNDEEDPFFRQDNVLVIYPGPKGKGQLLGLMIDNLGEALTGKKVGDTVVIETVGPEGHERIDLRGAKLRMTYEIRGAERIEPVSPADVAAKFGMESEAILREQIKFALEHRRDEEQATAMREQAIEQVANMVTMDLPEKLSAAQAARTLERQRLHMLYMGMNNDEAEAQLAELRAGNIESTNRRLKTYFLLHRLAEHFGVSVSEQEVNGRIAAIAAQRGVRPDKLRSELVQNGQLGEVASTLRDEKTADKLVAQATVTEVSADEWNTYMREKQANAAKASDKPAEKPKRSSKKSEEPKAKDNEESSEKPAAKKKTTKKK
jgi:trigger factor